MPVRPSSVNEGTGNIYVNYSPTRDAYWLLLLGSSYLFKYLLLIMYIALSTNKAEIALMEFINPLKVMLEL
mgnify:CR=1